MRVLLTSEHMIAFVMLALTDNFTVKSYVHVSTSLLSWTWL